ncbi:unnamed protein product, partial [Effrenium voratum]
IGTLLELDASVEEELVGVFEAIDEGELVRIDGLQNKQARKKLRHLLQAFRLTQEENGYAYRSSELKVSFFSIFQESASRAPRSTSRPSLWKSSQSQRNQSPWWRRTIPGPATPARPRSQSQRSRRCGGRARSCQGLLWALRPRRVWLRVGGGAGAPRRGRGACGSGPEVRGPCQDGQGGMDDHGAGQHGWPLHGR